MQAYVLYIVALYFFLLHFWCCVIYICIMRKVYPSYRHILPSYNKVSPKFLSLSVILCRCSRVPVAHRHQVFKELESQSVSRACSWRRVQPVAGPPGSRSVVWAIALCRDRWLSWRRQRATQGCQRGGVDAEGGGAGVGVVEEAEVEVEAAAVAVAYRRHHRFSTLQTRRPMLLLPQSQPLRQRPFPLRNSSLLRLARKHVICVAVFVFFL